MQVIESIKITEGTKLYEGTDIRGRGIIIIGLGNVTILFNRAADAAEMEQQAEIISMELEHEVKLERMRQQADDWMMEQGTGETVIEFVFSELAKNLNLIYEYSRNMDPIRKYSRVAKPVINYRSPILRPGIIRRGNRQSYKPVMNGP